MLGQQPVPMDVAGRRRTQIQVLFRYTMLCTIQRENPVDIRLEPLLRRLEIVDVSVDC